MHLDMPIVLMNLLIVVLVLLDAETLAVILTLVGAMLFLKMEFVSKTLATLEPVTSLMELVSFKSSTAVTLPTSLLMLPVILSATHLYAIQMSPRNLAKYESTIVPKTTPKRMEPVTSLDVTTRLVNVS